MNPRLVLTGGVSGIGATLVAELRADWEITVIDRATPASPLSNVTYLVADLTSQPDVDRARSQVVHTQLSEAIAHTEPANLATRAIKRASTTDDYVGPVRFLLSPGASFVTGQTLVVDGGSIRR